MSKKASDHTATKRNLKADTRKATLRERQDARFIAAVRRMSKTQQQWLAGVMAVLHEGGRAGVIRECKKTIAAFSKAGAR